MTRLLIQSRNRALEEQAELRRSLEQASCDQLIGNAFVVIQGESDTGKGLVARACGAIPETLIEAELFGSEKGAQAEGTLLLHEMGKLGLTTQVKLLQVLQKKASDLPEALQTTIPRQDAGDDEADSIVA
jgi:transcriptional regulator with PAS, ATPase and Fis domain